MPKKHAPTYTKTKPSYVHPSLQGSRAPTSSEPQTVNERIAQLRREQAPRPTTEQRDDITSVVSSRTVPPDLRRILQLPEINAPKPKAGTRMRTRAPNGSRLPPGPAVPHSWLQRSCHAPAYTKTMQDSSDSPARFSLLAKVTGEDMKRLPHPRSLQHQCLKTFALHFEELVEYEQHYLSTLPVAYKEGLLSYLTLYAPRGSLDYRSLKILYQDEMENTIGGDEVRFLDLTELLNEYLTIGDLGRCVKRQHSYAVEETKGLNMSEENPKGKNKVTNIAKVADSWDDEVDEDAPVQPIPSSQLRAPYFENLSRLSLGHPGHSASWPELLRISPSLGKITHLSLAYWPRPTLTPNAVTTSLVSQFGSQSLSGTPYYSDLDDDWHEVSNILRRFSIHTYSLEWLDLEGCTWLKALTLGTNTLLSPYATPVPRPAGDTSDSWRDSLAITAGPDWNDSWQRINYIHVFQGWIPADKKSLQNMPAGIVPVQLMRWLREHKDDVGVKWKLNSQEAGYAVAEWVDREKATRSVGAEIKAARKRRQGGYVMIDHGWGVVDGKV